MLGEVELDSDHPFDGLDVGTIKLTHLILQSLLAHGRKLIGHRLVLNLVHHYVRFAGVEAINLAGEGHDLNPIEQPVSDVITDDNSRAFLLNLAAHRGRKVDPPDLTALHQRYLHSSLQSTPEPQLPAPYRRPLHDSQPLGRR